MSRTISQIDNDIVVKDNDKIVLTLKKDHNVRVKAYDAEARKWLDAVVRWDGGNIIAEDVDRTSEWQGMKWDVEHTDLLDHQQFRYL